jgi:hypothetical protein
MLPPSIREGMMTDDLELGAAAMGLGDAPEGVIHADIERTAVDDTAVYLGPEDYAKTEILLREGYLPRGLSWSPEINLEGRMPDVPSTGVFAPEDRHYFYDRRAPWSAVGHIGWGGTGVLVGPRHVLTASHVVAWSPKPPGGRFTFGYVPGSQSFKPNFYAAQGAPGPAAPFGEIPIDAVVAAAPWPYTDSVYGITDAAGNPVTYARQLDVAVCILREPVGERAGWFGFSGWHRDWNRQSRFNMIGYPVSVSGSGDGIRPTIQTLASGASVHEPDTRTFRIMGGPPISASALRHDFDGQFGNSGGPIWGWFGKERMPRVVGVMSSVRPTDAGLNSAAGGMQMLRTIDKALKMFP